MESRMLIVGAMSTLIGVALLYAYMERFEREATGGELVQVAMLTLDIDPGTELVASMIAASPIPERYLESRHILFADADKALGMRVGLAGKAGEALLWTDLAGMQAEVRMLSQLVPEGMRAMPVRVHRGSLSRLLRPGDLVDVLFTSSANHSTTTSTLLQGILVLAIGDDLGSSSSSRSSGARSGEVTVSVTPDQVRLLATRSHEGDLELVLRNPDDVVRVEDNVQHVTQALPSAALQGSTTHVP